MEVDDTNDPKNKQFNEDINSVLVQFSKSTEWADFVKYLSKLNKVFEKYPKSTHIQSKLIISKRLSQCLNSSLPSGCHIKALETYDIIFSRIGQERLARDISIYATGLFPLFHLASTDVRVRIIHLYEKHILPLGLKLISCLNGVVSSILPGLEEGQGEAFEQGIKLLDSLCKSTSTTIFYQALWKTLITTPYNRLAATTYLLARLPKDIDTTNQIMYLPEKDTLVVQALSTSLSDKNTLVQRNMLELITVHFSISAQVFSPEALEVIVKSAIMVVTLKDMSLNRRLHSWLLGTTDDSKNGKSYDPTYFETYAKEPTINAFKSFFNNHLYNFNNSINSQQQQQQPSLFSNNYNSNSNSNNNNNQQQSKINDITLPFRILIFFFQKEEFQIIIDHILPDILRYVYYFKDGYVFSKDVVRYTDELLDSIQNQDVIWSFLEKILVESPSLDSIKLVECVLDIMKLSIEDVQSNYLPKLLVSLVRSLHSIVQRQDNTLLISFTQLLLKITGKIIVDTTSPSFDSLISAIDLYQDHFKDLSMYIMKTLNNQQQQQQQLQQQQQQQQQQQIQSTLLQMPILSPNRKNSSLFSISSTPTLSPAVSPVSSLSNSIPMPNSESFIILDLAFQMLIGLYSQFKSSFSSSPSTSPHLESANEQPKWLVPILDFCNCDNPYISCLAIRAFISLINKHGDCTLSKSFKNIITLDHFQMLSKKLWALLDPVYCSVHYKVASLFLSLRELNQEATSRVIADAMLDADLNGKIEGHQKFALLWRLAGELGSNSAAPFSNTLFLMLDSLYDDQPIIRLTGHTWLADSISKAERILDPLLKILLDESTIRFNNAYQSIYDTRRVIYVFKILKAIIECDFKLFIQHVIEKPISKEILSLNEQQTVTFRESPKVVSQTKKYPNEDSYISFTHPKPQSSFSAPPTPSVNHNISTTETSSDFLFIPTNSYIDLLVVVSLRFIQGQVPESFGERNSSHGSFASQNDVVQICAAEFLQYLLAKTSIQHSKALEIANLIQDPILQNLAQAVSSSNLVLQVHLLSLLRSIVLIDSSGGGNNQSPGSPQNHIPHVSSPSGAFDSGGSGNTPLSSSMGSTSLSSITQSQMFLQTTVVGLIQPSTKFNIRFYWLDFITFCLPRMCHSPHLPLIVTTIVNCLRDILSSFDGRSLYDSLTSRDIIVILKSLTFIFKFSILEPITPFDKNNHDETQTPTTRGPLGVRMFDFVKDVFTSDIDNSVSLTPLGLVRNDIFAIMSDIIHPLVKIWGQPRSASNKISFSTDLSSDTHNKFAIQDLIVHILDPFMSKYPNQFIEAMVDIWQRTEINSNTNESVTSRKVIMEMIYSLDSVKEEPFFNAAHQILFNVHSQERTKSQKVSIHKLTMKESALYDFTSRYIEEYPIMFDGVSTPFIAFVKESLHSLNPMSFVSQLQILNIYTKKLVSEEKTKNPIRARSNKRELQDLLPKIIDACFMISGKSFNDISAMYIPPLVSSSSNSNLNGILSDSPLSNSGSLSRPLSGDYPNLPQSLFQTPPSAYTSASTSVITDEGSSTLRARSSSGGDSNLNNSGNNGSNESSSTTTPSLQGSGGANNSGSQNYNNTTTTSGGGSQQGTPGTSSQNNTKLKKEATRLKSQVSLKSLVNLSNILASLLDSILDDKERIATLLSMSLHNVVPYLKPRPDVSRENSYYAASLFASLSQYPYNLKSIKKDVMELFYDYDIFKLDIKTLEQVSRFLNQTMIHDKTALADFTKVLSKPWNPAGPLMFVNKDTENHNRAKQLKRLSFIIWAGQEDQYLGLLPLIQEKIVESLKIPSATSLHLQVFFCLRVLLIKFNHQNLRSFWPIVITELIDILSFSDNSELILAACKFLDLALTLPSITEQFNLFEWVFFKDCFIKHSQEPPFLPFVDQIAKVSIQQQQEQHLQSISSTTNLVLTTSGIVQIENVTTFRPCIMIRSISDLPSGYPEFKSFLAHLSNCVYNRHMQSSSKQVDYHFINELLCFDFCELDSSKLTLTPDILLAIEKKQQQQLETQIKANTPSIDGLSIDSNSATNSPSWTNSQKPTTSTKINRGISISGRFLNSNNFDTNTNNNSDDDEN